MAMDFGVYLFTVTLQKIRKTKRSDTDTASIYVQSSLGKINFEEITDDFKISSSDNSCSQYREFLKFSKNCSKFLENFLNFSGISFFSIFLNIFFAFC